MVDDHVNAAHVGAIIILLTLGFLVITFASKRHTADPHVRGGMRLLAASALALIASGLGLGLMAVMPVWLGIVIMVLGGHLTVLFGYAALSCGTGARVRLRPLVAIAAIGAALHVPTVILTGELSNSVILDSLINGLLGLWVARRLAGAVRPLGRAQVQLATIPFLLITATCLTRLLATLFGVSGETLMVITLGLGFLLAASVLNWCFTLIAFGTVRLQRSLRTERQRAEEANAQKSRFLANMSHEIRTPLNGITGMAQVLQQRVKDPAKTEMLAMIRDSGEDLLGILNDILDLSKVEAGRIELVMQPFRPIDLFERAARIHRLRAAENGVALHLQADPRLNDPRLGDAQRVMQILNNLLGNAVKFTSNGDITLRAMLIEPDADTLMIQVQDSGIGMTNQQLARVFEDFVQADDSISRRFGGTGLGLSITRRLVLLMGGRIAAHSLPGKGTSISVELPLPPAPSAQTDAQRATPSQAPDQTPAPQPLADAAFARQYRPPGQPHLVGTTPHRAEAGNDAQDEPGMRRILLADDNATNRRVVHAMLAGTGHRIETAENGREALERFVAASESPQRSGFDLLVLDIQMPKMDGIEALQAIRTHARRSGAAMPVAIAFTANVMVEQVASYHAAGFDDILSKPLRREALLGVLKQIQHPSCTPPASTDCIRDIAGAAAAVPQRQNGGAKAAHGLASGAGLGHPAVAAGSAPCPGSTSPLPSCSKPSAPPR